jgi:hypothetical protein
VLTSSTQIVVTSRMRGLGTYIVPASVVNGLALTSTPPLRGVTQSRLSREGSREEIEEFLEHDNRVVAL